MRTVSTVFNMTKSDASMRKKMRGIIVSDDSGQEMLRKKEKNVFEC